MEQRRRLSTSQADQKRRRELSKQIQNSMRKQLRNHKREMIQSRLAEFKDLKSISRIRKNGVRHLLQSVADRDGVLHTDRQEIVDVFADFYSHLYATAHSKDYDGALDEAASNSNISHVTVDELKIQLEKMAKGKAPDANGIISEMFLYASDSILE
eukprot:2700430-Karenia_brevis.AAC.1